jgi:hypothetical protein
VREGNKKRRRKQEKRGKIKGCVPIGVRRKIFIS